MSTPIEIAWAMLDRLEGQHREEIAAALRADLAVRPVSPMEKRVRELGELAALLAFEGVPNRLDSDLQQHATATQSDSVLGALDPKRRWRVISRETYDACRTAAAPDSKRLVEKYGRWVDVCRGADGLYEDGRYTGIGRPWPVPAIENRGGRREVYTDEDCIAATKECETALGRWPSSNDYIAWRKVELHRRSQGIGSNEARIPTYDVIKKRLRGWPRHPAWDETP